MKEKKITKAAIINLGCKVNKYESDSMKDKLIMAGIEVVEQDDIADVYIVNTCSVTNMAQKKSRQMLRRARKRNPEAVIIAAGCYVNADHDKLKQDDFVDIVISNNCKKDIVQVIMEYINDQTRSDYYIDINKTTEYEEMGSLTGGHLDHQRAYIKIQDGCNQFCSYCIIPYTRGRARSRKPEQIRKEISDLAEEGVKEFVLTGIHISSYGVDFKGEHTQYDDVINTKQPKETETSSEQDGTDAMNLGELVASIANIPKVERIRLGSLEPRIVTDEFLQLISKNNKICPHFHLSLQSACNTTLKRMNRKYTMEEFIEKCERLRTYFDKPAITTDVIVGFPGETEEEFAITVENLTRLKLYEIHVFKYSVRAGTVAEKMPNQITEEIKGKRSECLLAMTKRQKREYENSLSGYIDAVLVEERVTENRILEELREAGLLNAERGIEYFTGHTKRYVKVKLAARDNIVNRVVQVKLD